MTEEEIDWDRKDLEPGVVYVLPNEEWNDFIERLTSVLGDKAHGDGDLVEAVTIGGKVIASESYVEDYVAGELEGKADNPHDNDQHSVTFAQDGDEQPPEEHDLAGDDHIADSLANLNEKVTDATLDDHEDERPPEEHDNTAHDPDFATETDLDDKADDPHGNESHDPDFATKLELETLEQGVKWRKSVEAIRDDPLADPEDGERYIIGVGTGDWEDEDDKIAEWDEEENEWILTEPKRGFAVFLADEQRAYVYNDNWDVGEWVEFSSILSPHGNELHDPDFAEASDLDDHIGARGEDEHALVDVTEEEAGFMSHEDKEKLDDIEEGANDYELEEHDLAGDDHIADSLANLNEKVTDATLDDHEDERPPEEHDNTAHDPNFEEEGVVEEHRENEVHDEDQPPQEHDNTSHEPDFLEETDYDPEEDVSERGSFNASHTSWSDDLTDEEIGRIQLQSGEKLVIDRIEFRQKGGGSSSDATLEVYDDTDAMQIGVAELGETVVDAGESGTANLILIRLSNATGDTIDASVNVNYRIVEQ